MYLNTKINTGIKLIQVFKYHFMSIYYTRTIWPEVSIKKVATEAENSYYNELFDKRTNSVKQLWKNLNTLSCFNQKSTKGITSPNCIITTKNELNKLIFVMGSTIFQLLDKPY